MKLIEKIAKQTKQSSQALATLTTTQKNKVLKDIAKALKSQSAAIQKANAKDIKYAVKKGLPEAMIDRLLLNQKRIDGMRQGVLDIVKLQDPVGEVTESRVNGPLRIQKVRIPLGVICMIYESRPNVTIDAAALCFKAGNAVVLRGGSEAFHSNKILVGLVQSVLKAHKIPPAVVSMVPNTDRKTLVDLLQLDQHIDLVIPRGGEGLMKFIGETTKIPVIKHDKGVCSLYVDESASVKKAIPLILNSKAQRPGVCNALESLYVHAKVAPKLLPLLEKDLLAKGVEIRADQKAKKFLSYAKKATQKDFATEYLDLILSIKVVKDLNEAIATVLNNSSCHTDGILSQNKKNIELFKKSLPSSCITVNTSTRFNDGGQLGLGAEIGISTTKLHAYGPMGLRELTTQKYVVESDYAVRK